MLYTHRNDIAREQAIHLDLTPVSQKVDSARFIQRITQLVSQLLIHWKVVYPVDSAIQRVNNRGLALKTLDSVNHRINHYPADSDRGNHLCLPLHRDLSGRSVVLFAIPFFTCK